VEYRIDGLTQIETQVRIGLTFAKGLRTILRQDPNVIWSAKSGIWKPLKSLSKQPLRDHRVFSTLHTNDAASAVHRLITMRVEPFLIAAALEASWRSAWSGAYAKNVKNPAAETISKPKGANRVLAAGYYGRMAIHEWLPMSRGIRDLILKRPPIDALRDLAKSEGMKTLREDGDAKARQGLTSLAEVMRVTQEEMEPDASV